MPSVQLNGETVHLKPQQRSDFQRLTETVWARLDPERPLREILASLLGEELKAGRELEDKDSQALLWALHDLGVQALRTDASTGEASIEDAIETDASRGDSRAMAVGAVESGRAFVAALANAHRRTIKVNGEDIRIVAQPREALQKMIGRITANRLVNEDLMLTCCRAVAAFRKAVREEKEGAAEELRAAMELASDVGVADLVIDEERGTLAVRDVNEGNAAAAALLQGASPEQVQQVRTRVGKMKAQIDEARRKAGAGADAPPGSVRIQVPTSIGQRQRRRV